MSARIRELRIRRRRGDTETVLALVQDVLGEYGFGANGANVERVRADLASLGVARESRYDDHARAGFWVAETDAGIVGTVAIRPKEGRTCELKRLYVSRLARGAGIGQALYLHAEAFAREAGYDRIWLESSRRFTQARRLYERNGFVLLEELDNDWEDNSYEKRLASPTLPTRRRP